MLQVEIDTFSGIPNPTFELTEKEEKILADRIISEPGQMSAVTDPNENFGLGYRGMIIRQIKSDSGPWSKEKRPKGLLLPGESALPSNALPSEFRLGSKSIKTESAETWLLKLLEKKHPAISDDMWDVLHEGVQSLPLAREAVGHPTWRQARNHTQPHRRERPGGPALLHTTIPTLHCLTDRNM